ncbi:MAG: hypothetical protein ACO1SV_03915 [Fimbriimonas sp.]
MKEDLFQDGWREPGDDCERLAVYLMMASALVAGLWMCGYGLYDLTRPLTATGPASPRWLNALIVAFGLFLAVGGAIFLRSESRHWNLRGLNAERVVAGLFLTGFAILTIALEMDHPIATIAGFGLGLGVLGIALVVGLVCAFAPQLFVARYRLERAYVVARFALDDKHQEIPNASPPFEPSWTPCVRLRDGEGQLTTLRATTTAYEFAEPGAVGDAEVRGRRIRRFVPRRPVAKR